MVPRLASVAVALVSAVILATAAAGGSERDLRVGFIAVPGQHPDPHSIGGLYYLGFLKAVRQPGVSGRVVEIPPSGDGSGAVRLLLRQRYDVIVTPFADLSRQLAPLARTNRRTRFLLPDAPVGRPARTPANVLTTAFRAEQAAYLAGYLAAAMEQRRPGADVVSSVGGLPVPQVDALIAGFQAGARAASPHITLLNAYSNTWTDAEKCAAVARDQIARGSGVVFNVAGDCGTGALQAAQTEGVFGIGVDYDQSFLGRSVLTSVVKREVVAMAAAIRALRRGTFPAGGELVFDLRNGGVGLTRISPRVPAEIVRRVERVRARIAAGAIKVPTRITKSAR